MDKNGGNAADFTSTPQAWPSDGERLIVSADVSETVTQPTPTVESATWAEPQAPPPATPVVRSAKDAINAMYAAGGANLSSYLGSTAPNPTPKPRVDAKSASNLHHKSNDRKMESTRPSASALFRMAKSKSERTAPPRPTTDAADPLLESHAVPVVQKAPKPASNKRSISVVSTSLKLAPKRPPIVMAPREPRRISDQINPAKGSTTLTDYSSAKRGTQASTSIAHVQKAAAAVLQKDTPAANRPRPKRPATRRGAPFQDVVRPANSPNFPISEPMLEAPAASRSTSKSASKRPKLVNKPTRSVKERFRPAPKGYARTEAEQFKNQGFADFSNPDHPVKAQHLSLPAPSSVDIYADEPKPSLAKAQTAKNAASGLGVVRDYRPRGDSAEYSHILEQPVASGHGGRDESAPDNNRYALGGQSPFFLKTVQVEKRPLSDGPVYGRGENGGTLYTAPKSEPRPAKNVYEKKAPKKVKPKKSKKAPKSDKNVLRQDIPARPTVIIPPSRRGHAPLLLLLLLTVILGATVGALAYLCFFQ